MACAIAGPLEGSHFSTILGAFAKLRKATSSRLSLRPSARLQQLITITEMKKAIRGKSQG
jgi:hypothetical protein